MVKRTIIALLAWLALTTPALAQEEMLFLSARCAGPGALFSVQNFGDDMAAPISYTIEADGVIVETGEVMLDHREGVLLDADGGVEYWLTLQSEWYEDTIPQECGYRVCLPIVVGEP